MGNAIRSFRKRRHVDASCCTAEPAEAASRSSVGAAAGVLLPAFVCAQSQYSRTVERLAAAASRSRLDAAVVVGRAVGVLCNCSPTEARSARRDVVADNPEESQTGVPIYDTLMKMLGVQSHARVRVAVAPVAGTDVSCGCVVQSPFYSQSVLTRNGRVCYRDLVVAALASLLEDPESRAADLTLQLTEAALNCVGRHREVFETLVIVWGEATAQTPHVQSPEELIRYEFECWADAMKRSALEAAFLGPLKWACSSNYEVYENIDSHGPSFWAGVCEVFLNVPYPGELIPSLDSGWSWAALDFLLLAEEDAAARRVFDLFAAPGNVGKRNWREVSAGIEPTRQPRVMSFVQPWLDLPDVLQQLRSDKRVVRRMDPYLRRFVALLSDSDALFRRALLHFATDPRDRGLQKASVDLGLPDGVRGLVHCDDPENISCDTHAFQRLLEQCGVDCGCTRVQW